MTTEQLLYQAADEMEHRGWCRNIRMDRWGRVCVLGALSLVVVGRIDTHLQHLREIVAALNLPIPSLGHDEPEAWALAQWSNASDGPTVIRALRDAAVELEAARLAKASMPEKAVACVYF